MKRTPYQAAKVRSLAKKKAANAKQTDGAASRASQKQENRFNSGGSLQSALNLNRKEAFDDETQMMEDTETDGNQTYETSTTDYLRGAGRSRNLDASFDSDDTLDSRERKDPTPTIGTLSFFSQNLSKEDKANARERKRLQEREWERDRQRKATAEPNKPPGKLRGIPQHKSDAPAYDDRPKSIYDRMEQPSYPRSSRQLGGNSLEAPSTGRDGYDSDSYIKQSREQLNNARQRTARASTRNSYQLEDSRTHDQNQHQRQRQPDTISTIIAGAGDSIHEDNTTMGESCMMFENSTADFGRTDANSYLAESEPKIKMTKMEKIKQLQMKNDRYKEEYKKTYLDKKEFKKKYEDKKMEVASLTTEIESYMKETALLKKQLSQLTRAMDHSEDSTRQDSKLVNKLQNELKQAQADLRQALGRIAERKMESSRLHEIMERKDEQIESLTLEVSQQIEEVQKLQSQISIHDRDSVCGSQVAQTDECMQNNSVIKKLRDENVNMKEELSVTLKRAAEMVKNREGTIEILRKENYELKELLDIRDNGDERSTTSERLRRKEDDIKQLKVEIAGLKETLNHSVDDREKLKNVISQREDELKSVRVDVDGLKKMVKRAEKDAQKAHQDAEEKDNKIASLQDEIRELGKHSKDAERNIQEANNVVHGRDEEIRDLVAQIESLKSNQNGSCYELDRARGVLDEKEQELKDLYRENEDLKAEMLQQRDQLDERRKRVVFELEEMKLREKDLHDEIAENTAMVKQREDAIEDLLKEVEKLKKSKEDNENHQSQELSKHEQNVVAMMKDTENMRRQLNDKGQELEHTRSMVKEREVAIEDLLRDIERLKQQGSDVEREIAQRTEKMKQELQDKNKEVEKLREEVEDMTNRLDETQHALQSKTDLLQEREESIEDLLQDMTELKKERESLIQEQKQKQEQEPDDEAMETLQRELETANDLVQKKGDKLRRIMKENQELKDNLEAIRAEKERLQQENDVEDDQSEEGDTKSYLIAQHEVLEEEIQQLNDQVSELQEELEDAHRQNSILNEEVEDWLQRGGNFELEIQRLKNEIEEWEDQAEQLKSSGGMRKVDDATDFDNASTENGGDQQAMMLEKAMAERQRKNGGDGKGVWGLFFNNSEEGPELTEDQKRIKELEAIKDAQADELQKIKSDLVKLTTTSRNESYVSKKRISDLEEENKGYKAKVDLLLRRLAEAQGVPYDLEDEKKTDDETTSSVFPQNIL